MPHIVVHPEEIPCLIHQSLLHWFQVTWKSWLVWLQYSGNPCQCQKCFISALQHKQLYIAVTWTVWGVASFVEYRLPVFVLGTSLKSSTFWCLSEFNFDSKNQTKKLADIFVIVIAFWCPPACRGHWPIASSAGWLTFSYFHFLIPLQNFHSFTFQKDEDYSCKIF